MDALQEEESGDMVKARSVGDLSSGDHNGELCFVGLIGYRLTLYMKLREVDGRSGRAWNPEEYAKIEAEIEFFEVGSTRLPWPERMAYFEGLKAKGYKYA